LKRKNYGVNCDKIRLRLYSALIFTTTAISEGLFATPEGCISHLGVVIIHLQSFMAQYFQPSIVYIFNFLVIIPLWQR
jgi:hypothetical protein